MPKGAYDRGRTVEERFWAKVNKSGPVVREGLSNCWIWTGANDGRLATGEGYGKFHLDGKFIRSHRVAYQLVKGDIASGMLILHECDNPQCVNPDHLRQGTHTENMREKAAKGRCNISTEPRKERLTREEVLEIYQSTKPNRQLAREFDVSSVATIRNIKNGIAYNKYTAPTPLRLSACSQPSPATSACTPSPPQSPSQTDLCAEASPPPHDQSS